MIRSSSHSLNFCNKNKKKIYNDLINEYRRVAKIVMDDIWDNGIVCGGGQEFNQKKNKLELPKFISKLPLLKEKTWLSARMKQAINKQVLQMIKSAVEKRRKQLFVLRKYQQEGKPTKLLQRKIDIQPLIKPTVINIKPELDSRFVDFKFEKNFLFLRLASIGNKIQLKIPIKETSVYNKWNSQANLKSCVRLTKKNIHLIFETNNKEIYGDEIVGADQGLLATLSLSNGTQTTSCPHGHDLSSIIKKLSRKKKGSKSFKRTQEHRLNYINWSLNQLNFNNIKELRLEKIKNLRYKSKTNRNLSHWTYTLIKDKLIRLSETEGFVLKEVDNQFRSQRCSSCGWVRKSNRRGKTFVCTSCGYAADADSNAASNLMIDLYEVPYWVRLKKINLKGFYWDLDGLFNSDQESIVPDARKNEINI